MHASPPDIFAELKLIMAARAEQKRLAAEGLEHQAAGRIKEARRCLERAEEIERRIQALLGGKTGRNQ